MHSILRSFLGRLLRDPASRTGDVHWAVVEGLSDIAGQRFELSDEGLRAADAWLRQQGVSSPRATIPSERSACQRSRSSRDVKS
jgi:hypothetical protein